MEFVQLIALLASFVLGVLFLLAAARPQSRSSSSVSARTTEPPPHWPALLGTGLRNLDPDARLRIAVDLAARTDDARIPVLLCAREEERDERVRDVVERALGTTGRPVIGEPQSPT